MGSNLHNLGKIQNIFDIFLILSSGFYDYKDVADLYHDFSLVLQSQLNTNLRLEKVMSTLTN